MTEARIIKDTEQFEAMRDRWNGLLAKGEVNHLYLTHEFLLSWWKNLGDGAELLIVEVTDGDDTLAIAPLMITKSTLMKLPVRKVEFIGSGWGYGGIIVGSDRKEEALEKVFDTLKAYRSWTIMLMSQTVGDPDLPPERLEGLLPSADFTWTTTPVEIPYIPLEGTWDDYLMARSSSFRRNARAKERKVEKLGSVEFVRIRDMASSGVGIDRIREWLRTVAENSWKGPAGTAISSDENVFSFYTELTTRLDESGGLDLSFLMVDGKPIAYIYGALHNSEFFEIDIAFDESCKKVSPGVVLRNMHLRELFNEDVRRFDFVANYDYKSELTSDFGEYHTYLVYRKGLYPQLLHYLRKNVLPRLRDGGPSETARRKFKGGAGSRLKRLMGGGG